MAQLIIVTFLNWEMQRKKNDHSTNLLYHSNKGFIMRKKHHWLLIELLIEVLL